MTSIGSIREEDLHAYLDDELAPGRRAAVEAYLAAHPEELRRLDAFRRDAETIRRLFGTPLPAETAATAAALASAVAAQRRVPRWQPWIRRAAAALFLFAAGSAAGWFLRTDGDAQVAALGYEGASAHALLASATATPVALGDVAALAEAISTRLGTKVKLPSMAEFKLDLVSSRFVAAASGPAVQLVYRDAEKHEVTVFLTGRPGATETPFEIIRQGDLVTVAWQGDDLGCAITGRLAADTLKAVGRQLYDAIES